MSLPLDRRQFLSITAASSLALGATSVLAADEPASEKTPARTSANDTIVLGIMGTNGRGTDLARGFVQQSKVEIAYVCDVDERAIGKAIAAIGDRQKRNPDAVADFRRILDDAAVDALVIAAPDHWHSPATILACAAGKHVYVEKPCCHNPREGEQMVEAARKHNRVVQHGTQRRSIPGIQAAIEKLKSGGIGRILLGRAWYNNRRPSIGHGKLADVPRWLNYGLWQGPAPEKPYRDNIVHYNWHWFWHWGTGEIGNNGVHGIDVVRWGMGVDYPKRVTSSGGKYRWDDDQETPDTHLVTFDFDGCSLVWEGRSWSPRGFEGNMFGMAFYGDEGSLVVRENGYELFDMQNKSVAQVTKPGGESSHYANFLDCIRTNQRPNADIEEGYKSALLCHLGNISHRVGRILTTDPQNGHIQGDAEAQALWSREYRSGWEPSV